MHDGIATFRAPGIGAKDALEASNIDGEITNMTNVTETRQGDVCRFRGDGRRARHRNGEGRGEREPARALPTFDLNLTVKGVKLPKVNPWLREYIKADAEGGDFELYTELAAADGKFRGYAKPIMKDVNIYSSEEPEENPFKRLWEGIVEFAAEVFEDQDTEQVAARIPFSGTIQNPDAGLLETVVSVMRNAFVSAFARSLEGSVSIRDVRENIGKIGDEAKPGD